KPGQALKYVTGRRFVSRSQRWKQPVEIFADTNQDHAMTSLRDAVPFSVNDVVAHPSGITRIRRGNGVNAVPVDAAPHHGTPLSAQSLTRGLKIGKDAFKQALMVQAGRQQSFDVLHYEDRRPVVRDDLEVFHVEELAMV